MILSPENIPSQEVFDSIIQKVPLNRFNYLIVETSNKYSIFDMDRFACDQEYSYWHKAFNNKINKIRYSFAYLNYYYDMGIPDKEWFVSPGLDGSSIQYFPHCDKIHHENKFLFSYYYENLYSYFFSSYDIIFHLLNSILNLELESKKLGTMYNSKVLELLKERYNSVFSIIFEFKNEVSFMTAKKYRNDIIHNKPPYEIGHGITRFNEKTKKGFQLGVGDYTPSDVILENIKVLLLCFHNFLLKLEIELNDTLKRSDFEVI